jgi:integrase
MPIYKRDGIFYGRVKNTRGQWISRTLNTEDRVVAKARYREFERSEADPAYRAAHETTISTASDEFEASRVVKGCAEGTMHMYRVKLGHLSRLLGADLPLAHLDAPKVDRFIATRLQEGAARNTIGKELTALRGLLRVAQRAGKFQRALYEVMPTEWSNDYIPRRTTLTSLQVTALVKALACAPDTRRNALNQAALVAFIVATGARWSEALRAERSCVDLKKGLVYFEITKTRQKGKREKYVPITPLTRLLLEQVLAATAGQKPMFAPWANVRRDLAAMCATLKIPKVSPNDLRRTHANWLRDAGVDLASIADVLGHVDSRMVEKVYGKLRPEQLRDRVLASTGVH